MNGLREIEERNRLAALREADRLTKGGAMTPEEIVSMCSCNCALVTDPTRAIAIWTAAIRAAVAEAESRALAPYLAVQRVLDEVLGTREEDGAGAGIEADVRLALDRVATQAAGDATVRMIQEVNRARQEERAGTRDILEEAEDLLALYEVAARANAEGHLFITMPAHEFINALNIVRRARSMEDRTMSSSQSPETGRTQ